VTLGSGLHLRGRLLLGPEEVRDEAWVLDGRLTYTRPTGDLDLTTVEGWILPGLVDAHCHVGLGHGGRVIDAQGAAEQARTDRDAGALLLRDAGSPADTRWMDAEDDLPVILRAGRHIARTRRYIRDLGIEVEPPELAAEVGRQLPRGDGWIKLVGDWIDRSTGDLAPCWPVEAAAEAIAAAHASGARVTAHCFGEQSLVELVEAGIDCIEHGSGLTEQTVALFAERGVAVVPTLVNLETFPGIAASADGKFDVYAAHMRDLYDRRYEVVRSAYEAGVPLYAGTDAGGAILHGRVGDEVLELAKAGLPPVAALDAACWGARAWLRRPGMEEGAPADLVVYAADPREELQVVTSPSAVVLRGVVR
jgi:imidazolonepropionase-like amidohydrolase